MRPVAHAASRSTVSAIVLLAMLALAGCTATGPSPPPSVPATSAIAEPWRPAAHFSPKRNWMNDPNGTVYADGVYHLFYQYNPTGSDWGSISWGHATSRDLVTWTERPLAIRATAAEQIFSGSVVADTANTSGLGDGATTPLIALYTSAYEKGSGHAPGTQAQSLAYSLDGGTTWKRYAENPVLTLSPESSNFRDPKVFWYEAGGYWVMATVVADARIVKLYRSSDLIHWRFLSDFDGSAIDPEGVLWEMPDLIPLPLDGDQNDVRWVMIVNINPGSIAGGSGARYFVGRFDGRAFQPDALPPSGADPADYEWLDHGADYYAATTFSGAPGGAPISIAWMSNWDYAATVPTSPWRGSMALPRELALVTLDGLPRLVQQPVRQLRDRTAAPRGTALAPVSLDSGAHAVRSTPLAAPSSPAVSLVVRVTPSTAARAGVIVHASADGRRGTRIVYDRERGTLTVDRANSVADPFSDKFSVRHIARVPLAGESITLRVVVDRGSVEVFADDGRVTFTELVFPRAGDNGIRLLSEDGVSTFDAIRLVTLP